MAKLKTIRCGYCKKLLWSARWQAAKRDQYDSGPPHTCPGLAQQMRGIELARLEETLAYVQVVLAEVLPTLTALVAEEKKLLKPTRKPAVRRRRQ